MVSLKNQLRVMGLKETEEASHHGYKTEGEYREKKVEVFSLLTQLYLPLRCF